jgi:iron complex outermembrane receptor protein
MTLCPSCPRPALAVALSFAFASGAFAQNTPAKLPSVVVTGNPLGSEELATPATVLNGEALVLRRGSSLGETLNGLPGVSSTYFGPNASRPVIRGLDGDRVRMLDNAGASFDASALSFDHAVPIDPLIVNRVEVLRGPAALLYGGSAIGGAVNAINNRIPKERVSGVTGAAELRLGGAESERGGAALVETGTSKFALHADVFGRKTDDLRVPDYTPVENGTPLVRTNRVRNSASRTDGGAIGGSLLFDQGYLGASVDDYSSRYGTPAEAGVHIDMKRQHEGLAGEYRMPGAPITAIRAQFNHTHYQHQEVDAAGAIGTTFKTDGNELRLEAEHAAIGRMKGAFGLTAESSDFSALGDEAFVPTTHTKNQAIFALEELPWSGGTLTAGLRLERAKVSSDGDADPAANRFGAPSERRFSLKSASLSNLYKFTPTWSLTGSLSYTERAPTSFELYANGLHAATGTFERGDPTLKKEQGTNLDVALAWKDKTDEARLGLFTTRFSRFISLDATGNSATVDGDDGPESVPEYAFKTVRARLSGLEFEGRHRLLDRAWKLDVSGKLDYTRATNLDTGEPLPRVAPLRALAGLDAASGPWSARLEVDHAARQSRFSAGDKATASYTLVNASLLRRFSLGATDAVWFVKLNNLGDKLAYSASTIQTVRDLSPLPGRSIKTGVRVSF